MSIIIVEPTFASKQMAEAYIQSKDYVTAYIINTAPSVWVVYLVLNS